MSAASSLSPVDNGDGGDGDGDVHFEDATQPTAHRGDNSNVPKPKRLACIVCRKRKLKCDGVKPNCSTCSRLGHECAYDEVRRKSGPKRGYVKALEERLKQVEILLRTQEPARAQPTRQTSGRTPKRSAQPLSEPVNNSNNDALPNLAAGFDPTNVSIPPPSFRESDQWQMPIDSPTQPGNMEDFNFNTVDMGSIHGNFTHEIIHLGLDEPLPPQETIDELHEVYFDKIHPSVPMIHQYRYRAAMNLAPHQRPPVCLRYAIWTLACSVSEKYNDLKDLFYQRARKYIEADYMKGYGEHLLSVAHAQTHVLLASYEFKMMYFPRAWMSAGSALRLSQMAGLHRLDGSSLEVKQCIAPPKDWTEKEERRRTFWMAFCEDRYASIGTGWPMMVDERDISTNLPSSEEAFELSWPEATTLLGEAMSPTGAAKLSPFGGIVLMACFFGRNLVHLHRPDSDNKDHDLNGEYWKRHRNMDNILLNTSLCLPAHLKLPAGVQNPNIVYMNMCIHTSTICLHQAAIFKAEKNRLPPSVSSESKVRCITAANEIASVMKMVSHMDLSSMNPFMSFCLYVAARVFVQYLKSRPDDSQTTDALRFILAAMSVLKRKNPLTESFLVQLDVDLEALGDKVPRLKAAFPRSTDSPDAPTPHLKANTFAQCEQKLHGILMGAPPSRHINEQSLPTRDRSTGNSPAYQTMQGLATNFSEFPNAHTVQTASSGTTPGFDRSDKGGTNDASTSPGGMSNRPTPNSSTGSENNRQQQQHHHMSAEHVRAGRTSFAGSPASPPQNGAAANTAGQTPSTGNVAAFFADPNNGFTMGGVSFGNMMEGDATAGTAATAANPDFNSLGWNVEGQTEMTPVAEGVMRTIIDMGPMESMDMGWAAPQ